MITKYLTSLTVSFNPLSPRAAHRVPRLLLSFVPPAARTTGVAIKSIIIPTSAGQDVPSSVTLSFKDGKELRFLEVTRPVVKTRNKGKGKKADVDVDAVGKEGEGKVAAPVPVVPEGVFDLGKLGIRDVVEEVDRHSRVLKRKEELGE